MQLAPEDVLGYAKRLLTLEGGLRIVDELGNHIVTISPESMKSILGEKSYARMLQTMPSRLITVEGNNRAYVKG